MYKLYTKFVKQTFESKPQPINVIPPCRLYYIQNSSNKLLKANHNTIMSGEARIVIIYKIRQTNFWKQTTTPYQKHNILSPLYTKFVKQTFESKPQPVLIYKVSVTNYIQNSSNKLLKANHNIMCLDIFYFFIIYKIRQTNFWKQTTTHCFVFVSLFALYTKFVKQTFESKPQLGYIMYLLFLNYIQNSSNKLLKANHNIFGIRII